VRLYHVPQTRSTRVLWLLEEIGEPYDITVLAREDRQTPEHRERHPLGRVPVIEENGGFVFESAAICLHLADQHPEAGLLPPPGTHERALAYQWTLFAMTELESGVIQVLGRREKDPEGAEGSAGGVREAVQVVERALDGHEYLVGDRFTVADLVCAGVLGFAQRFDLVEGAPNVSAFLERMEARPARRRANAVA